MTEHDGVAPTEAGAVATLSAKLAACTCACGCIYGLLSTPSKEALRCWSCRHGHHLGGTPLTKEDA